MIGKAISETVNRDDPNEVSGKLEELKSLQASCSHAVALAEMVYNEKIFDLVQQQQYSGLNATEKKMLFAGLAKQEIYYVTLTERQSRSMSHAIEAMRSILSYLKSEMNNLN